MNKPTSDAENSDVKKELARFIIEQVRDKKLAKEKAAEFLAELSKKATSKTEIRSDDVAIIGVACQFPDASNKEEFWHNLVNGHNAIDDFPDQRRADLAALDNNETELFKGGFLSSVDRFDNEYFNIPPNVARHMDPYQRLLMQSLVEAIEDAGYSKSQVYGKKIGVFVGNDHTHRFFNNYISFIDDIDFNSVAGSWTAVLASRLSYLFNLKGPALVIDTACSSGLVALDSAVKAIQNGDCESALVSAANLFFAPGKGLVGEIENDDFMVRAFDQGASGTVWGEGIASILVKPLAKAKEDGDAIYGVVKGIAINNDGASNGLTAPNAKAQEDVIKSAWQKANINPEAVSYIETHGTGTKLGDPIEIKGLVNAFRGITKRKQFCGIGSVKTNIGHTVGVAGLASLIKVLLGFQNKQLPPSINFHAPNPFIDFANSPVYINDQLSDWSSEEVLTAGISSFSLSGTNCHLVIQESPTQVKQADNYKLPVFVLPLSARSHELLVETVNNYIAYLRNNQSIKLKDLCFTAAIGREHHPVRAVAIAENHQSLEGLLLQLLEKIQINQSVCNDQLKYHANGYVIDVANKGDPATRKEAIFAANQGDLDACLQLSDFYLAGVAINWNEFYQDLGCSRLHLPAQVFKVNRFWDKKPGGLTKKAQVNHVSGGDAGAVDTYVDTEPELTLKKLFAGITEDGDAIDGYDSLAKPYSHRIVAYIWSQVMGYEKILLSDDFYALGGDSITATKIIHVINQVTEINCQLSEILSVSVFSDYIEHLNQNYQLEKTLQQSLQASSAETGSRQHIKTIATAERYELSRAQIRMLLLQQMETNSTAYNVSSVIRLPVMPEVDETNKIFNQIIQRHEILRSHFVIENDKFYQVVQPQLDFRVETTVVSPAQRSDKRAFEKIIQSFVRAYDLSQSPLMRIGFIQVEGEASCYMVLDMHHIITDGSSMGVLISEYLRLQSGEKLAQLAIQYKDFAAWQNAAFEQGFYQQQRDFWLATFSDELPVLNLQTDFVRPVEQSVDGGREFFNLDVNLSKALQAKAQQQGSTLFTLLLAAFKALLFRMGAGDDLVIGTPVAGRSQYSLHSLIGMFVNTLCLRNQVVADEPFENFLARVKHNTLAAFSNQDYPYEELIEDLGITRQNGRNPLFDIYFVLQNADMGLGQAGEAEVIPFDSGTAKFDMTIITRQTSQGLQIEWEYMRCLFEPETVRRIFQHYQALLISIVDDSKQKISEINLFRPQERQQILEQYNQSKTNYPKEVSVNKLFEIHAEKTPQATALIFQHQEITYAELNEKANQLANYLIGEKGVTSNSPIAILYEPSVDMVVAILAVLKAGCYYVPLDTANPVERSRSILSEAGSSLLLTHWSRDNVNALMPNTALAHQEIEVVETHQLDFQEYSKANLNLEIRGSDLIYIMFTSGTTGRPKGTQIRHRSVVRVVCKTNYVDLNQHDTGLLLSNYAFDGCVFALLGALLNGGRCVLATDKERQDLNSIAGLIEKYQVTQFFVTTALFNLLVDNILSSLSSIRYLCFGGEAVSVAHTKKAFEVLGPDRLIHCYGPTETTVFATAYTITSLDGFGSTVPIGKAIANTTLFVLDEFQQPVAHGISGELYIGGDGVALGYFERPELTAEKFVSLPFAESTLYRTGDFVKWDKQGNLVFLGRIDHQVKVRGYRIELSEIEGRITQYEFAKDAFVCVKKDQNTAQLIVAYVVPSSKTDDFKQGLAYYLNSHLPVYMQPAVIVLLDELPLNINGKVDQKGLPEAIFEQAEIVLPTTEQEKLLVQLWQEMLSIEQVSIYDNFFALGGDSVKAIQMASRLQARGYGLESTQIFQQPALIDLAKKLQTCEDSYQAVTIEPQKEEDLGINKIEQEQLEDIFADLGID